MSSHASATPDAPRPVSDPAERIAALDVVRGLAVMGILAANIVGFGQPFQAYLYPGAFAVPHGEAASWLWVAQFVLIDGKIRGLFTLLFGAGLYLFMEKAWARGATIGLQVRRLLWLGLFGAIHFFLIWRGDILFLYAVAGLAALLFIKARPRSQFVIGLIGYLAGALIYAALTIPMQLVADSPAATASPDMTDIRSGLDQEKEVDLADAKVELGLHETGSYLDIVRHTITVHWSDLAISLLMFAFETLPLMLIGMALYRRGLFGGGFDARKLRLWGWAGLALGGALSLLIALRTLDAGLTYYGTLAASFGWAAIPRLFMTLGLFVLLAQWAAGARGWLAERVSAAGRAAFTNYLGTSILMMLVFHGWAGGLFGKLGRGELYLVTIATWVLMLAWSKPWLERYRYGPLEWLWRCLTYGRRFTLRR